MKSKISIIAAVAKNGVIGNKNNLPWYLPADLKHFAKITKPHIVIMGRKTYESIIAKLGKPLPDRTNIILTRQKDFVAPGCIVISSIQEAISQSGEKFIIGGEEIFRLFMPIVGQLYITEINADILGDAKFPEYDKSKWVEVSRENHLKDDKNQYDYSFVKYEKRK